MKRQVTKVCLWKNSGLPSYTHSDQPFSESFQVLEVCSFLCCFVLCFSFKDVVSSSPADGGGCRSAYLTVMAEGAVSASRVH